MRRHLLVLALPILLAACGQNTPEPAAQAEPAIEVPAVEVPAVAAPEAAPAPVADADTAPLFGTWAGDPANCEFPIEISATSFEGAENICEITSLADNGDGSFTAALTCDSQGEVNSESIVMTPLFGPTGEGIRLNYVDRGGDPVTVFRCRAPQAE